MQKDMQKEKRGKELTFLKAETILKYLESNDDKLETIIICKPDVKLITTDQSLYEALGSVKNKQDLNYSKLLKFVENVEIISYKRTFGFPRRILSFERQEELQKLVQGENNAAKRNEFFD